MRASGRCSIPSGRPRKLRSLLLTSERPRRKRVRAGVVALPGVSSYREFTGPGLRWGALLKGSGMSDSDAQRQRLARSQESIDTAEAMVVQLTRQIQSLRARGEDSLMAVQSLMNVQQTLELFQRQHKVAEEVLANMDARS